MSVHRKTSGEWAVRWRDAAGRNRQRTVARRRDATLLDAELRRRRQLGTLAQLDSGGESLDSYVSGTFARAHLAPLAATTRKQYASLYDAHISPVLGSCALRDLTPDMIATWQGGLLAAGTGRESIRKTAALLSTILQRATESERIIRNPARLVRPVPPSEDRREVRPLSPAEVERLRGTLGQRDATLVSVLAYCGLRPGEALALRWRHVGERVLTVHARKTRRHSTRPRTVPLPRPVAGDLAAWRLAQGRPGDDEPVFPDATGARGHESYKSWARRTFAPAVTAAGLPAGTSPYTLRHSYASLLLHEGRSVIEIARGLGHRPSLTLDTYGSIIDELAGAGHVDAERAIRDARCAPQLGALEA